MCETQVKDDKISGCKYSEEARPYMNCRLCGEMNHPHCAALSKIENGFYKNLWGGLSPEERKSLCETQFKKLNCCACDNTISVSKVIFRVEFVNGEVNDYCTYCMAEKVADAPEQVKRITNVGEHD